MSKNSQPNEKGKLRIFVPCILHKYICVTKTTRPMVHTYYPSYFGGWDKENHSFRPAQAKKFRSQWKKAGHSGTYLSSQWIWEA
jgi:hypothetical protein